MGGWVGGWLNTDYKASLSPQLKLGLGLGLSLAKLKTFVNDLMGLLVEKFLELLGSHQLWVVFLIFKDQFY